METFINALPSVILASGATEEVIEAACIGAWKHAVGATLGERTIVEELHGGTLLIAVEDKVWQSQLNQMRDQFLFRLNKVLGRPLVKALQFRVVPEKFRVERQPQQDSRKEDSADPIPIELVSAAASIEDPSLRRAFLGAAVSCDRRLKTEI